MTSAASGKLILLGEHAVVYGAPALVMSIDRGLRADVAEAADAPGSLSVLDRRWLLDELSDLPTAARALLNVMEVSTPLDVVVTGSLPPGVGLGFSACAGVAVARAVNEWRDRPNEENVMEAAMAWEGVFHGNPSGVDVAASINTGCLRFAKKEGVRPVGASRGLSLCIGLTGVVSATREMVASVARLRERQPDLVRRNVEAIASLVENGIGAVEDGRHEDLGHLMNYNQMLLAGLMVSSIEIEQLCDTARVAGATGAKLSGAGGGGVVAALSGPQGDVATETTAKRILAAWRKLGYDGFEVHMEVASA